MSKILITGHMGFIGRHLFRRLSGEHEVVGIDIKNGQDIRTCALPDVDIVIHLAARPGVRDSVKYPEMYWAENVDNSKRIFDYYNQSNARILYASSSSAKRWWLNPYATTKKVVEQIAPPTSLGMRFHTVYGFDSRPDMLYDKILNKNVMYCTKHVRDFTHVDDIVEGICVLLDSTLTGVVDIGTGQPVAVKSLFKAANIPVRMLEVEHEAEETCADPIELFDLGWRPAKNVIEELNNDIVRKASLEKHTQHW